MRTVLLTTTALTLMAGATRAQQLPTLLAGEATRPPWQVAGVDYAVGVPSGTALQNPALISAPGVSVNSATRTVSVTGSNVTLNSYDFANWSVQIAPGASNTTITNSNFAVGSNNAVPINAATGSGNLTVTNSTLNGESSRSGGARALINYNGSGTFTAQNNAFLNAPADGIDFNAGTMTTNVTGNLFENLGTSPGSHPDPVQYDGVTSNNSVESYNTIYQPNASGEQGIQLEAQGGSTLTNTKIQNNTIVAKGPTGQTMSYGIAVIQDAGNNAINGATVSGNYLDSSGSWGPFYPPSGSGLDFGGNVNMTNGQTFAAPSGTSSAVPAGVAAPSAPAAVTVQQPDSPAVSTPAAGSSTGPVRPAATAPCGTVGRPTLGAEIGDPPTANGQSNYASFVSAMGQAPAAIDTYLESTPQQFASSAAYSASGIRGINPNAIPVVGIPMAVSQGSASADFRAIAGGQWDSAINNAFAAYASAGFKTIIIRPGWEMNGSWEPWSVNPGNAAGFVAAFQHIATIAHAFAGATVRVTWNPGYVTSATSYMSIWPGNASVDSIGIDTYGAASGVPDTAPFANSADPNTFTLQDAIRLALANGKSLALPEVGGGPSDTAFPQNLASVVTTSGVPVSYISIWDDQSGGANGASLHWSDNSASAAAWKAAWTGIQSDNTGEVCDPVGSVTSLQATAAPDAQPATAANTPATGTDTPEQEAPYQPPGAAALLAAGAAQIAHGAALVAAQGNGQ